MTTFPDCVLAVDLGTGGPKVAVVSPEGDILAHEFEPTDLILLPDHGVEQDPDDWWRAIVTATRRLLDRPEIDADRVAAMCMSGQWSGTVAVDETGAHLHNALIWMDGRGEPRVRTMVGGGIEVPGTGYNARKLLSWLRLNGGVPSLTGQDPVGQIQWLRHERPEIYDAASTLLDVPEYLTMRLSGKAIAAYDTIASRWCTDNREPGRVRYHPKLLAANNLDRRKLPELVPGASIVGAITTDAAAELGLGEHVLVVAGTGDTTAAAIGAGAVADYEPHLYVGTSSWISAHVPFKKTNALQAVASLPSVVPDRYWVATIQDVAGKAISWMIENLIYPDDELATSSRPTDVLHRLNALAESVPAGSNDVLFFPWLNGERTPAEDGDLRGSWFNLSLTTDRATMVRSMFEGIALNARWMLEAVQSFVGSRGEANMRSIRFIGGGASSPLWCQIMADVLDVRILQVDDPTLANVRGAGLIGLVALERLTWEEIPHKVKIAAEFTPDPANRVTYDRLYATFRQFHQRTKPVYSDLNHPQKAERR